MKGNYDSESNMARTGFMPQSTITSENSKGNSTKNVSGTNIAAMRNKSSHKLASRVQNRAARANATELRNAKTTQTTKDQSQVVKNADLLEPSKNTIERLHDKKGSV